MDYDKTLSVVERLKKEGHSFNDIIKILNDDKCDTVIQSVKSNIALISTLMFCVNKIAECDFDKKDKTEIISLIKVATLILDELKKSVVKQNDITENDKTIEKLNNSISNTMFGSKDRAFRTLEELKRLLRVYNRVSVGDYFSLCGIANIDVEYDLYGWTSLDDVGVLQRGVYYTISLPTPTDI